MLSATAPRGQASCLCVPSCSQGRSLSQAHLHLLRAGKDAGSGHRRPSAVTCDGAGGRQAFRVPGPAILSITVSDTPPHVKK